MRIYRVEFTKEVDPRTGLGCGPYAGAWYVGNASGMLDALDVLMEVTCEPSPKCSHLAPPADPLLGGIMSHEVCGFDTLQALHDWFGRALGVLERNGFEVRQYEVPEEYVRTGLDGQVVFAYRHAVRVQNGEVSV